MGHHRGRLVGPVAAVIVVRLRQALMRSDSGLSRSRSSSSGSLSWSSSGSSSGSSSESSSSSSSSLSSSSSDEVRKLKF